MCGIPVIRRVVEHPVIVERNKLPPPKPLPLMLTKKVGSSASSDAGTQEAASQEPCGARGGETHQDPGGASPEAGDEQVLGAEATLRPTWADNLVREQMAKRKLAHEMRNEER